MNAAQVTYADENSLDRCD